MISIIMPTIAAVGCVAVIIVIIVSRYSLKKTRLTSVDLEKFNSLANQIIKESSETKKDIQEIKQKIDIIEKIMKDI